MASKAADPCFQKVAASLDLKDPKACTHCCTRTTSLWRNGPIGPKSLCNACGLRYQRKRTRALLLEGKKDKGNNKRSCMKWARKKRKAIKLYIKVDNGKKNRKAKGSEEEDTDDCWKETMLPHIQQHGEEQVKAAIQLMNLSRST